jgi:hypothetical protein
VIFKSHLFKTLLDSSLSLKKKFIFKQIQINLVKMRSFFVFVLLVAIVSAQSQSSTPGKLTNLVLKIQNSRFIFFNVIFSLAAATTPAAVTPSAASSTPVPVSVTKKADTTVHVENVSQPGQKAGEKTVTGGSNKISSEMTLVLLPLSILAAKLF